MTAAVTADERRRDRIALAIFAVGALMYGYAYLGMHALMTQHLVTVIPHQQERRFTILWQLSRLGLLTSAAGAVAMAWSYFRYRQRAAEPT